MPYRAESRKTFLVITGVVPSHACMPDLVLPDILPTPDKCSCFNWFRYQRLLPSIATRRPSSQGSTPVGTFRLITDRLDSSVRCEASQSQTHNTREMWGYDLAKHYGGNVQLLLFTEVVVVVC